MKTTQMKSMIAKVMATGFLAGAVLFAAPKKADAAQFSIGVQLGNPDYGYGYSQYPAYSAYPDYYARRDYYDRLRWEQERRAEMERREWMRHERHEEHERWEHRGNWHGDDDDNRGGYGYNGYYRR